MRGRRKVLDSLEATYREAFDRAREREDIEAMERLDLDFQRDQIGLEVLLDIRDLLGVGAEPEAKPAKGKKSILQEGTALIEKAGAIRRITRFPLR